MKTPLQKTKSVIKIVGCGVSGLTTALVLQRAGYAVRIHTREMPADTTSAVAAAIWFPYKTGPMEAVNHWSRQTYDALERLSTNPDTGVSMVDFTEFVPNLEAAWWLSALPEGAWRPARPDEVPAGQSMGFVMRVPMVETPIYLPYLLQTFQDAGGEIVPGEVRRLDDLLSDGSRVINCTGLGAKELVGDSSLYPIRGQLLRIAAQPGIPYMSADEVPGAEPFEATYVFPRKDGIILGGTAVKGEASLEWDEVLGNRILQRCKNLVPRLETTHILATAVGLRPGRDAIRVELEGNCIHNYGHGGAGFTVSWGCAEAVLELLKALDFR